MVLFAAEPEVVLVDRARLFKRHGKAARVREQSWRKTVNLTCLSTNTSSRRIPPSNLMDSRQAPDTVQCANGFWSTFCVPMEGEALPSAITNNDLLDSSSGYGPRYESNEEAKSDNLVLAGLEFQCSDHPAFPKKKLKAAHYNQSETPQQRNGKVVFNGKDRCLDPLDPLTEEEKKLYFWNEDENQVMKEERRSALLDFKDQYLGNNALLWDDNETDSIRGLEDHTAKLLGNKHSYYIRREHLCAVMEEFHTQRWHGRYDPQRLCRVSEKSSFLRRKIAVERALADREAAI